MAANSAPTDVARGSDVSGPAGPRAMPVASSKSTLPGDIVQPSSMLIKSLVHSGCTPHDRQDAPLLCGFARALKRRGSKALLAPCKQGIATSSATAFDGDFRGLAKRSINALRFTSFRLIFKFSSDCSTSDSPVELEQPPETPPETPPTLDTGDLFGCARRLTMLSILPQLAKAAVAPPVSPDDGALASSFLGFASSSWRFRLYGRRRLRT
mmetsp:Transcript_3282/g.9856  ORF Transcript_3282/g.9856 Transcript_3282/m.9856 type:complete len:211 (-) Transcript_3282:39-671(-)